MLALTYIMFAVALVLSMLLAHYFADYALQSDYVARTKAKAGTPNSGGWHTLIAHSSHHALCAGIAGYLFANVTGAVLAGFIIGVSHGIIDYQSAVKKRISPNKDQALHITFAIITGLLITPLAIAN